MTEAATRKAALDAIQFREVSIRQDQIDDDSREVEISFSSDAPVLRRDVFGQYFEVLSHEPGAVRLDRLRDGGAILMDHDHKDQVGAVRDVRITGGKCRARIRFGKSARATEVFQDVQDEIRSKVSVGYRIHAFNEVEGEGNEPPTIRITDWEPMEISLVSIPADVTVGVGRSNHTYSSNQNMSNEAQHVTRSERRRANAARAEHDEILLIGERFNERELAERIALEGGSEQDLKNAILAKRNNVRPMPGMNRHGGTFTGARVEDYGRRVSPARRHLLAAFGDDKREADSSAYRCGMWLRGCFGDENAKRWFNDYGRRAMGEGTFTKGGAVVPYEMANAIVNLQDQYGTARQFCNVWTMSSDTLSIPRRTSGATTYYVSENSEITESDAAFDQITLVAKKLAALTKFSTEVAEDAVIDLAGFLADEFARRFSEAEDSALFNGDGTSSYGGIAGLRHKFANDGLAGALDATAGDDEFSELIAGDLDRMIAAVPQYALNGATWFVSPVANALVLQSIARAAGGVDMIETGNTRIAQFGGFPIHVTPAMPNNSTATYDGAAMILFGNMQQAVSMGVRRDMHIKVLDQRYAEYDQIGVQATERFDIVCHDLGDDTTAGPLVALLGNTS